MKAVKQCFPEGLFVILLKVVFRFESEDKILKFGQSNENLLAELFLLCVNFYSVEENNIKVRPLKCKLLNNGGLHLHLHLMTLRYHSTSVQVMLDSVFCECKAEKNL